MNTFKAFTLGVTLARFAVPSFAGLNYNASKSNTGNIAVQNPKGSIATPEPAVSTTSCPQNKCISDGAAKGQANE